MPARTELAREVQRLKGRGQDLVRRRFLKELAAYTKRDTIVYASAVYSAKGAAVPPWLLAVSAQDVQGFMTALHGLKGKELDLVLHSTGGSADGAEQIVNYLRSKYAHIRAIVPHSAMSAATMIACACDEIIMGRQSALGPIDPQVLVPTRSGPMPVAAYAVLAEFERAKAEVSAEPKTALVWGPKVKEYPPGILDLCQQATEMARDRVKAWLAKYMFRGDSRGQKRARQAAEWLASGRQHKSHGHPINYELASENGLSVKLMEEDQELQDLVLSVFHATILTFEVTDCIKFVENHEGRGWFQNAKLGTA